MLKIQIPFSFNWRQFFQDFTGRWFRRGQPVAIDWPSLPRLLSLRQTAELLGVHRNTLRDWDRRGYLPAIRIGARRDRRYEKDTVQAVWLSRAQVAPGILSFFPPVRRWWRPVTITAAAVALVIFGLHRIGSVVARESEPAELVYRPAVCRGWIGPLGATGITLPASAGAADYNRANSAYFSSQQAAVSGSLASGQIVTGRLDQLDPELVCQRYATVALPSKAEFESSKLIVSLTSRAALNSTDSLALEASLDGEHWELLTVAAAGAPPTDYLEAALPLLTSLDDFDSLQIRVRPEGDFGQSTEAWMDGLEVRVRVQAPSRLDPIKVKRATDKLDRLTEFSQSA